MENINRETQGRCSLRWNSCSSGMICDIATDKCEQCQDMCNHQNYILSKSSCNEHCPSRPEIESQLDFNRDNRIARYSTTPFLSEGDDDYNEHATSAINFASSYVYLFAVLGVILVIFVVFISIIIHRKRLKRRHDSRTIIELPENTYRNRQDMVHAELLSPSSSLIEEKGKTGGIKKILNIKNDAAITGLSVRSTQETSRRLERTLSQARSPTPSPVGLKEIRVYPLSVNLATQSPMPRLQATEHQHSQMAESNNKRMADIDALLKAYAKIIIRRRKLRRLKNTEPGLMDLRQLETENVTSMDKKSHNGTTSDKHPVDLMRDEDVSSLSDETLLKTLLPTYTHLQDPGPDASGTMLKEFEPSKNLSIGASNAHESPPVTSYHLLSEIPGGTCPSDQLDKYHHKQDNSLISTQALTPSGKQNMQPSDKTDSMVSRIQHPSSYKSESTTEELISSLPHRSDLCHPESQCSSEHFSTRPGRYFNSKLSSTYEASSVTASGIDSTISDKERLQRQMDDFKRGFPWMQGYSSEGDSIEVYVDGEMIDQPQALAELVNATKESPTKFKIVMEE